MCIHPNAFKTAAVVLAAIALLACFEITEVSGPTDVDLGDTVEYVLSFVANEDSSEEWTGEIWWEVPRGWTFLSGEYEGVASGVPFSNELVPTSPTMEPQAGCFGGLTMFWWAKYRQSAPTGIEPPVTAGDTGTATLRFRVDGAPGEYSGLSPIRFSASMRSGTNYFCGAQNEIAVTVHEPQVPRTERHFIPQAGHGAGSADTVFDTSVVALNLAGSDRETLLSIWPGDWGGPITLSMTPEYLGGGRLTETRLSNTFDGLGFFFSRPLNVSPFGLLQSDLTITEPTGSSASMIQSVIFATNPDGREFGQYFQGRQADHALQTGETGLIFTTHDPFRYRVNIGVVAMENGTQVTLTPRAAGGEALADPVIFRPNFFGISQQFNNIYHLWGLAGNKDVMIEAHVESGSAFVYGSVLDGRGQTPGTSDPTTILPVTTGSERVVLLELGRITGLNDFSGSASVFNHDSEPVDVRVDFHERGVPGVAATSSLTISGRETVSWDDAVGELVGRTEVIGALVFTLEDGQPGTAGLSAMGREFSIFKDAGQIIGTAGQAMPGLADIDMLMPGETFHFIGLRDRELAAGPERSHLGLLNLGSSDATVKVAGFADDGSPEGTTWAVVVAGEQLRLNRVLRAINRDQDGGLKRIEVTSTGSVHALAYRVNAYGDPVTLRPFRR